MAGIPDPTATVEAGGTVTLAPKWFELNTNVGRSSARVWFPEPLNSSTTLEPLVGGFAIQILYSFTGSGNGFAFNFQNNGTSLQTNQSNGWLGQSHTDPSNNTFFSDPYNLQLSFDVDCWNGKLGIELFTDRRITYETTGMNKYVVCTDAWTELTILGRNGTVSGVARNPLANGGAGAVLWLGAFVATTNPYPWFSAYDARPYYFGISRGSGAATGTLNVSLVTLTTSEGLPTASILPNAPMDYASCVKLCPRALLPSPITLQELLYTFSLAVVYPSDSMWLGTNRSVANGSDLIYLQGFGSATPAVNVSSLRLLLPSWINGWPVATVGASWIHLRMQSDGTITGADTSALARCVCAQQPNRTISKSPTRTPSRSGSTSVSVSTSVRTSGTRTRSQEDPARRNATTAANVTSVVPATTRSPSTPANPVSPTQIPNPTSAPLVPTTGSPAATTAPGPASTPIVGNRNTTRTKSESISAERRNNTPLSQWPLAGAKRVEEHTSELLGPGASRTIVYVATASTLINSWLTNPATSSQVGRVNAVLSTVDCTFTESDRNPSYFDFPIQASLWASDFALYTGSTFLTCLCFIVAPFAVLFGIWFFGRRVTGANSNRNSDPVPRRQALQHFQRKVISTLCFVALGYFGPVQFKAFIVVVTHLGANVNDIALVSLSITFAAGLFALLLFIAACRAPLEVDFTSPNPKPSPLEVESQTSVHPDEIHHGERTAEFDPVRDVINTNVGSMFVETFGAMFDACRWRNNTNADNLLTASTRFYFLEELFISSGLQVLNGVQPAESAGCSGIASGMLVFCAMHLLYLITVRPYHERLEQWLAVIGALLTLALNCLCLVATLCEEAPYRERLLDVLSIFSVVEMSYFFLQALLLAIAALAELHRRKLQQQWQNNSSEQHNSSVEESPVLKPPARTFNDERNLTELQNPLLSP